MRNFILLSIIPISIILFGVIGCENPTEPKQSENEFIIELYSYTAGAVTKPYPRAGFTITIWSSNHGNYFLKDKTDESGRYTISIKDKNFDNCRYQLYFGMEYNSYTEFGKTHVYKRYL